MLDRDNFIKPDRGSTVQPDHIMLSICGDAKTSMCVTWRTCFEIKNGYMLISPSDRDEFRRVDSYDKEFESDIDLSMMHYAKAQSLQPGTEYRYTVGNDEYRSPEYTFTTEPENLTKFKFVLITDQQREDPLPHPSYQVLHDALTDAIEKNPDISFIFTGGDNCNNGQNEIQWNGMFSGLEGIIEHLPYMMCTGNHDNRGYQQYLPELVGKYYASQAFFFDAQFANSYPMNGPEDLCGENYSFDYGNAHFASIGINYQQEKLGEWLYNDLKASDKRWKIGAYHFPIYPVMPEGVNDDSYPWLRKGIEQGRLDILFNGHEHSLARTYPIKDDTMYDRPSQGTVHYIAGNAGRNIFCTNCRKIWHTAFYPQEEKLYLYCIVEVDEDSLTVTAHLEDGRIADSFTIDKKNDIIRPYACAPVFLRPKMSFKGVIPELAARGQYCEERDGIMYCAFGTLVQAFGGDVERTKDKIKISMYSHSGEFYNGSSVADTDSGRYTLSGAVYKSPENGQLYIPAKDAAEIFNMDMQFSARNNLLNFDYQSEQRPMKPNP